jgi:hypothetical protein
LSYGAGETDRKVDWLRGKERLVHKEGRGSKESKEEDCTQAQRGKKMGGFRGEGRLHVERGRAQRGRKTVHGA